jgi:hypothetical protein
MTTFYYFRFDTPKTWRARSPYLYPPGTGWPSYTPRHCIPFLSPPTTCRAMMEVFDPASTLDLTWFLSKESLIKHIGILGNDCSSLFTWKCVPYWVGLQESTSMETCLSTRSLAMGPHVTICFLHFSKENVTQMHLSRILHGQTTHVPCFMFGMPNSSRVRYNFRTITYHVEPQSV